MAGGGRLSEEVKIYLVTQYALFEKTAAIVKAVKEQFGLTIDNRHARRYDGDSGTCVMGKKYRTIFDITRKDFLDEVKQHPVAHRAFRIQRLGQMADKAYEAKNYVLAAKLMEQAAKETGGAFTNEVNVKGKVRHDHSGTVEHRSPEEKRNLLADIIGEAITRIPDKPTVN